MKKLGALILVSALVCGFLRGLTPQPRDLAALPIPLPYYLAPDRVPFTICGTVGEFYDSRRDPARERLVSCLPYSHDDYFTPDTNGYLIRILKIRDLNLYQEYERSQYSHGYSVATIEIVKVLRDTMELKVGDRLVVSGMAAHADARGCELSVPLEKGRSYYCSLSRWDTESSYPVSQALAALGAYSMSCGGFNCMPLREDGMVEYYELIMPGGKDLGRHVYAGSNWAKLPQAEFEAGMQELYQRYCEGE